MAANVKNDFIEELKAMKERMEELFVRNFTGGDEKQGDPEDSADWVPLADIVDTGQELLYILDLPGVPEENLKVECKADRLWVSGSKRENVSGCEHILMERPQGGFSRVFKFPCAVEGNAIRAEFRKGVLRITVPKSSPTECVQRIIVREVE